MSQLFKALPGYFGGKRRLAKILFALLADHVPQADWRDLTFVDAFLGGGSVSLLAKAYGFAVACNDVAYRSTVIGHALIANDSAILNDGDLAVLFQEPNEEYAHVAEDQFSPSIFSRGHAHFLDRGLHWARSGIFPSAKRYLLELLLVRIALRTQPMSQLRGTDARAAIQGDLDRVSPQRLRHYLDSWRLLQRPALRTTASQINGAVFPGRGSVCQMDVIDFLASVEGDVLYLDPPYPSTTSYESEYRALDILLDGHELEASRFSRGAEPLTELLRAAENIPVWLISFGNAVLDLGALTELVRLHKPNIRAVQVPYRHLGSLATEEKNAQNKEFVVLAWS